MTPLEIILLVVLTVSLLGTIIMCLLMIIRLGINAATEIKENEDEISKVDNNE